MTRPLKAWLFAACAIAGFGCTDTDNTQVLTGRVTNHNAVAVRAIDGDTIITAGRVRTDGSFTLQLPAGHRYRLEVLTSDGVHNVVGKGGTLGDLAFKVCQPTDPFDMGQFGEPGCDPMDPNNKCDDPAPCDPMSDPNCGGGGGGGNCDPMSDPNCGWPCDPTTDPMCKPPCDPMTDPTCNGGGTCDPMTDPNCGWPCDPTTDPMCKPPCDPMDPTCGKCEPGDPNCGEPCDPMTDPGCPPPPQCDPSDPDCQVCMDDTDPNCKCDWWMGNCDPIPPCDPTVDAMCPTPPPPCDDPMDPNTCKDPCVSDPNNCGCTVVADDGNTDPTMPGDGTSCWPPPEECTMQSCPDDPMAPEYPPGDFGCEDGTN
jgi:hypothetical protein